MSNYYTDVTAKSDTHVRFEEEKLFAIEDRIRILKTNIVSDYLEIGDLLLKAKERVPHGEWETWLKEKVDISPRHASRIMSTASKYLPERRSLYTGLSFTKLLNLSILDEEKREEFISIHDCEKISANEIKTLIQEASHPETEVKESDKELFQSTLEKDLLAIESLDELTEEIHGENLHLSEENKVLKNKVEELEAKIYGASEAKGIIDELQYLTEELENSRGEFTLKLYNNTKVLLPYRSYIESKIRLLREWQELLQLAIEGGHNESI